MKMNIAENVGAYIASFPADIRERLEAIREAIRKAAPEAEERISYGMPAYFLGGPLVYFAAFQKHIGFYATPTGHQAFEKELSAYKQGKGSVQFPHDRPLPLALIENITKYRVDENLAKKKKSVGDPPSRNPGTAR